MELDFKRFVVVGDGSNFHDKYYVGRPNIGDRELIWVRNSDILDRRWLTTAVRCFEEFERHLAKFMGVKHYIAMCNSTDALEITTLALDLPDEVIIPSLPSLLRSLFPLARDHFGLLRFRLPYSFNRSRQCTRMIITRTTGTFGVHL
jgi:hypothetical protein